jgi:hypothetical protein
LLTTGATAHTGGMAFRGKMFATFNETGKEIELWSVATDSRLAVVEVGEKKETVWSVYFSPDGTRMASKDSQGTVKIWELGAAK